MDGESLSWHHQFGWAACHTLSFFFLSFQSQQDLKFCVWKLWKAQLCYNVRNADAENYLTKCKHNKLSSAQRPHTSDTSDPLSPNSTSPMHTDFSFLFQRILRKGFLLPLWKWLNKVVKNVEFSYLFMHSLIHQRVFVTTCSCS